MGLFDWFGVKAKEEVVQTPKPDKEDIEISIYVPPSAIQEQFKGEITKDDEKLNRTEIGEKHPFDFSLTEGLYKEFGFVTGVIDKYVDFVVGPGFFVSSDDERAKAIIEQFMRDMNFDTLLRAWIKEALIKGSGFIEIGAPRKDAPPEALKVLDAKYMYIKRDNKGNITGYTQAKGQIFDKVIDFKPHEISLLTFNQIGESPYGMGVISPAINTINSLLKSEKDMRTLMSRKANVPIHAKLGSLEHDIRPQGPEVNALGEKLQFLNNKHEWATGPEVEFKVLDFGNIGDKFNAILKHDIDMLFFTFQVPEVLMGRGSIPEGLAAVQMEAFERRIQSMQAEIEKVIENQIFKRVLRANGFDVHVEFEWGQESNTKKNERITKITELLKLFDLNPLLRNLLEAQLAKLMDIKPELIELPEDQREREETEPQPEVPGQKRPAEQMLWELDCYEKVMKSNADNPELDIETYEAEDMNLTVKEFVGFDFDEYLQRIYEFVDSEEFGGTREWLGFRFLTKDRQAWERVSMSYSLDKSLGKEKVDKLRLVLKNGFREGADIRTIASDIKQVVKPGDLTVTVPALTDSKGKVLRKAFNKRVPESARSISMARTETARVASRGSLDEYESLGVKKASWVAGVSERTCPFCSDMDGQIFEIGEVTNMIPVHSLCRCAWIPVVE